MELILQDVSINITAIETLDKLRFSAFYNR